MITVPTGDLVGILNDVLPFAWPDDDYKDLNCVRLEWDGEQLHAITTDRIRLGWATWEAGDVDAEAYDLFSDWGSGDRPWSATLALHDATEIAKVFKLPPKQAMTPLTVDYDQERQRITVVRAKETGHSAITYSADDTFVEFPDVRAWLAAGARTQVREVGYSSKFLADFAKVRAAGPMKLRFTKGLTQIAIGKRFIGAIQPVSDKDKKPTDDS